MDNVVNLVVIAIYLIIAALIFGAIGAAALANGIVIAGAICFIIVGFILGTMFGFVIANLESEDEGSNDLF